MIQLDFIQGDKFMKMGDFTYSLNFSSDCNKIPNTLELCCLKDINIVYTHTMYVRQLFDVIRGLKQKFVIVTHNCDEEVNFEPPDNVIRWFAQNVAITHPRIESIPIGLENDKWYKDIHKKDKMVIKTGQTKHIRNLLYINHNISTYPGRNKPYRLLAEKTWVTARYGTNGKGFDEYLDDIYNHKYVICPRGNGIDTHRLWECLYLGAIPIVEKDTNNWFYNDLPILYIKDWEEVTEELLNGLWPMFAKGVWNWEKLTFKYWANKIRSYAV